MVKLRPLKVVPVSEVSRSPNEPFERHTFTSDTFLTLTEDFLNKRTYTGGLSGLNLGSRMSPAHHNQNHNLWGRKTKLIIS